MLGSDYEGRGLVPGFVASWLTTVSRGVHAQAPFLAYGTDWLAFAHFAIAIAFLGALRDPVRNRWLFRYGLILCVLVPPWAFVFGSLRGIPWWWRLVDSSFGLLGALPLWACARWVSELEAPGRDRTF